jgi:ribose/xylose/arabinose/galactoside ABC-type transport system permease subunit
MMRAILTALRRSPELGLIVAIAAALGIIRAMEPSGAFFDEYNLRNLLHDTAMFGALSVGVAVVIIAGGIDLSIGSLVALSAVVAARLMTDWLPGAQPPPASDLPATVVASAVALTLLLGAAIGVLHAVMINNLRLPAFIATLATLAALRSVAILVSDNQPITVRAETFRVFGSDNRYTVAVFAAVAIALSVVMGSTVLGRHLYALGGNEAAARLSGLPTRRLKVVAYALSGLCAALAGLLFFGNSGTANGRSMGMAYELYAITAAVVGGCSLSGGLGTIRGTVLGLILIQIVIKGTGLVVTEIDPTQIEGLVLGTVVVLAVAFNHRFRVRGSG